MKPADKREIKFRAWDKKDSLWVDGFDITSKGNVLTIFYSHRGKPNTDISDRVELMQYIGLKDKNSKEIYEGDIVRMVVPKFIPDENGFDYEVINVQIYFENGSFWFKGENRTDCNWHHYNQSEREVIGNIYENPELLNSK